MTPPGPAVDDAVELVFAILEEEGYRSLSDAQRNFLLVWSAVGEIDNGGFEQFFLNSSGDHAHDTPAAFEAIGAPTCAMLVRTALDIFPNGKVSGNWDTRRAEIEALPSSADRTFAHLNQQFDSRCVDDLLEKYVHDHAKDIFASRRHR